MAITAAIVKLIVRGKLLSQQVEVVQHYFTGGAGLALVTCADVADAYWQDIKTDWMACHQVGGDDLTQSVFCEEVGGSLGYGEYAIPVGEQEGSREDPLFARYMPPYVAVAVRLTVATRTTRPGQKRFWGAGEVDNSDGVLQATLAGLVETLSAKFDLPLGLGAPAATVGLTPCVVRYDRTTGAVLASQVVVGHLVNGNLSTQNSRKFGRGA